MKPVLLFDLDGTLTDDDDLHFECMRDVFAVYGVTLDRAAFQAHVVGALNADIAARFFPHLGVDEGRRVLVEKEAMFRTRVEALTLMPGVLAVLDFARAQGVGLGLVTNAPRINADAMLKALNIRERFDVTLASDDVAKGKPDPLPYLAGLRLLGGDAMRALAFEDSVTGATAAVRAGLTTVGICPPRNAERLRKAGVAATATDFTDPQVMEMVRATLSL